MTILYKAVPERGLIWQAIFAERTSDLPLHVRPSRPNRVGSLPRRGNHCGSANFSLATLCGRDAR